MPRCHPTVRAALVIVFILAGSLLLSYACCVGAKGESAGAMTADHARNTMWLVYGLVCGAVIIGLVGAFAPTALPLASTEHFHTSSAWQSETFAVDDDEHEKYDRNHTHPFTENLLSTDDWTAYVHAHTSHRRFTVDNRAHTPVVGAPALVVHGESKRHDHRKTSAAHLHLPLTRLDEAQHEQRSRDAHCDRHDGHPTGHLRRGSPPARTRTRSYIFRVWVTARSLDELKRNVHPFDIRYQMTGTRYHTLPVHFRVVPHADTKRRHFNGLRWYHVESAVVELPRAARRVFWTFESPPRTTPTDDGPRYWCELQVRHQRDGAAEAVRPSAGLQALYSTFLTPQPFGDDRRTWHDASGFHHASHFVDGPVALGDYGGVRIRSREGAWHGPSSATLLGDLSSATSNANRVTPFTLAFLYTPSNAVNHGQRRSDGKDVREEAYRTLFTIYADYRDWYAHDNPPNYLLRVQVHPEAYHLRIVQQDVDATTQQGSDRQVGGAAATKTLVVPLRNDTNDPVLYTLCVDRSTLRDRGNVRVYANTREETHETKWLDLNYNINADRQTRIVWGETLAHATHRDEPRESEDIGTLYAFAVYDRALDATDVSTLHRHLLRAFYADPNGASGARETQAGHGSHDGPRNDHADYRYHTPSSSRSRRKQSHMSARTAAHHTDEASRAARSPTRSPSSLGPRGCDAAHPCATDMHYCDFRHGARGQCVPCEGSCSTEALSNAHASRSCRRVCRPKLGDPFHLRTSYTDAQYLALTPAQKLDVLQNKAFIRSPRVFAAKTEPPYDGPRLAGL